MRDERWWEYSYISLVVNQRLDCEKVLTPYMSSLGMLREEYFWGGEKVNMGIEETIFISRREKTVLKFALLRYHTCNFNITSYGAYKYHFSSLIYGMTSYYFTMRLYL